MSARHRRFKNKADCDMRPPPRSIPLPSMPIWLRVLGVGVCLAPLIAGGVSLALGVKDIGEFIGSIVYVLVLFFIVILLLLVLLLAPPICWGLGWRPGALGGSGYLILVGDRFSLRKQQHRQAIRGLAAAARSVAGAAGLGVAGRQPPSEHGGCSATTVSLNAQTQGTASRPWPGAVAGHPAQRRFLISSGVNPSRVINPISRSLSPRIRSIVPVRRAATNSTVCCTTGRLTCTSLANP